MTPEAQQIAIAEWWGWKVVITETAVLRIRHIEYSKDGIVGNPPDYLNDLNAVMEACSKLAKQGWRCVANMGTDGTWECFFTQHYQFLTVPGLNDHYGSGDTLARAMSEAILRTVNVWKD